ncbi:MAG TPA: periplasmic heavy metal sensor, partial [Candidatus Binatia bacterium]|nr:periplasmic heavy metal sensor [Candidatus Binatia bacterium]
RQKFSEIRAAGDPVRRDLDGARAQALDMLSAERFDESGYDRQISRIEELRAELFKQMAVKIKQTAKELSPEERRMFADVLRRPSAPPQ